MSGLGRAEPALKGVGRWLIRFAGALARGGDGASPRMGGLSTVERILQLFPHQIFGS